MESTIAQLELKRDSTNKRFAPIFSAQLEQYRQCSVQWLSEESQTAGNISDLSRLEEQGGYGNPVPVAVKQEVNY